MVVREKKSRCVPVMNWSESLSKLVTDSLFKMSFALLMITSGSVVSSKRDG